MHICRDQSTILWSQVFPFTFIGFWELNSGLQVCSTNALPTEPSHSSLVILFCFVFVLHCFPNAIQLICGKVQSVKHNEALGSALIVYVKHSEIFT